jgi:hypothetical protein
VWQEEEELEKLRQESFVLKQKVGGSNAIALFCLSLAVLINLPCTLTDSYKAIV